jgi:hypothetical protein
MNAMYFTNFERNRVIYELWMKKLTVEQISSSTGIPRSSVGYYVRKFNRLASQGKPIVFPDTSQGTRKQGSFTEDISTMAFLQLKIQAGAMNGDWEGLYYRLNVLKLLKELGLFKGGEMDTLLVLAKEGF